MKPEKPDLSPTVLSPISERWDPVASLIFKRASCYEWVSRMKLKKKSDPTPGSDSTSIFPPKEVTIYFEMTSPSPIPLVFCSLVLEIVPNSLNSLSFSSLLIPSPVSRTEIWTLSYFDAGSTSLVQVMVIEPVLVNFKALE